MARLIEFHPRKGDWSTDPDQAAVYRAFTRSHLDHIPQLKSLDREQRFAMRVVGMVLPFRVSSYVIDELIDWNDIPDDPIFQLTFPQREMLAPGHFDEIASLMKSGADKLEIKAAAHRIQMELNPHPAEQRTLNVPELYGIPLEGLQHKYRETVLFFPSQGQTCHSYCTFCFRWAQFVGDSELKISAREGMHLRSYLKAHPDVTDLLVTGGDPMVMRTINMRRHLEPLLSPEFNHLQTIRIGTKALSFWPYRFVTDPDADDLLRLLNLMVKSGKHVALMAHVNHWRELTTPVVKEAVRRIRDTGAVVRSQAPLLAHINDDAGVWSTMWRKQVRLGIVPYYMFVERDTGARRYFEVPLAKAWEIYRDAMQKVSGLGRTARGPSMSAGPGKVEVQGITEVHGEKVFVLRFIQARNPDWVQRPFFARFDPRATWLDDLRPAFGESSFFYEDEYAEMQQQAVRK